MKLKTCTCGQVVTTKSAKKVVRQAVEGVRVTRDLLWFNCGVCGSTLVLKAKTDMDKALIALSMVR